MADTSVTFQPVAEPGSVHSMGDMFELIGTLTWAAGDYVAGGLVLDLASKFKAVGLGKVYHITGARGYDFEYVAATNKIKIWVSAGTEHTVATLDTDLTGSPMPVRILGR
jgi:hypothetical protein